VAKHKVAAELLSSRHGLLEVHARSRFPFAHGSFANGFGRKVGGEFVATHRHNREAATIDRDAVGDGEMWRHRWRLDRKAAAFRVQLERFDRAEVFDNASEHEIPLRDVL
jgi:hypothetical protein